MRRVALVILVLLLARYSATAGGLDHWTLRNSAWVPYSLYQVCYGGNQFVAAGEGGTLLSSSDGYNWVNTGYSPSNSVYALAYANGEFLGTGNGFILRSTNGINWDYQASLSVNSYASIAYGNGVFVGIDSVLAQVRQS